MQDQTCALVYDFPGCFEMKQSEMKPGDVVYLWAGEHRTQLVTVVLTGKTRTRVQYADGHMAVVINSRLQRNQTAVGGTLLRNTMNCNEGKF